MLNSPSPVNFVHIKRIVLACYEARLKFQNVVLTGGPLYTLDNLSLSSMSFYLSHNGNVHSPNYFHITLKFKFNMPILVNF